MTVEDRVRDSFRHTYLGRNITKVRQKLARKTLRLVVYSFLPVKIRQIALNGSGLHRRSRCCLKQSEAYFRDRPKTQTL